MAPDEEVKGEGELGESPTGHSLDQPLAVDLQKAVTTSAGETNRVPLVQLDRLRAPVNHRRSTQYRVTVTFSSGDSAQSIQNPSTGKIEVGSSREGQQSWWFSSWVLCLLSRLSRRSQVRISLQPTRKDLWQVLHSQLPVALRRFNSNTVAMLYSEALLNSSC